jgi:hypothetical protein
MNETNERTEIMGKIFGYLVSSDNIDTAILTLSSIVERVTEGE